MSCLSATVRDERISRRMTREGCGTCNLAGDEESPTISISCSRILFGTCGAGVAQLMMSTNHRPSSSLVVMVCGNCAGG